MGIIKDFLESLKDQRKEDLLLPDALTFPAIDAKKLEVKLSLEEKAKEQGTQNYPKSDATEIGSFEAELTDEVTRTVRPLQVAYTEAMNAYSARISALDPLGFDAALRAKSALLRAQIGMTVNQVRGEIFLYANNLRQREKEYKEFKEKEGNPADPHLTFTTRTKFILLFSLILFEAIINGLYIGPYLAAGFLEGVGIALAFPLITLVLFGWMAGVSLRKVHKKNILYKLVGVILVFVALVGATVINLFLAAIRTAVEISDEGMTEGKKIWLEYLMLNFDNINSQGLLLLFLTTGFFVVAIVDIYSFDHHIPGYLKAYKLRETAHSEYSQKLVELSNKLLNESKSIKEFAGAYNNLQSWQMEFNNILNNRAQLTRNYKSYLDALEDTVNRVLAKYREVNEWHRTSPVPKYFDTRWRFNEYRAWILDDANATINFQNNLTIVYNNIEVIQKEISLEIDETINILQPIDVILSGVNND